MKKETFQRANDIKKEIDVIDHKLGFYGKIFYDINRITIHYGPSNDLRDAIIELSSEEKEILKSIIDKRVSDLNEDKVALESEFDNL